MLKEKIKFPLHYGRKLYGHLKKDLMLFYNRKKYLYIFLLFPVLIAGLFLFILSPTTTEIDVGICNYDQNPETERVLNSLESFDIEVLNQTNCTENLKNMIRNGELSLGLEISEGFSERIENMEQSYITMYYDNTDIAFSNMVHWRVDSTLQPYERKIIDELNQELERRVSIARQSIGIIDGSQQIPRPLSDKIREIDEDLERIEKLNTDFLINPIRTDSQGIYENLDLRYISIAFLFPIISLFLILMLTSVSIIYDYKNGFITKVKTSTSILTYIISKILFFFILTTIIFLILYGVFLLAGASLSFNIVEIIKLLLMIAVTNSFIGMLIGNLADNEGIAILMSLFISFPLMLLSGLFFPVQNMPNIIQSIIRILPLNHQIEATKSIILFNQPMNWSLFYITIPLLLITLYVFRLKD